jgi:hypothetical protein
MSDEVIYQDAYHEGVKDALNIFLLGHMEGLSLVQIRERLVNARTNAKVILNEIIDQEEKADEEYCICGQDENNPNCEWCF